MREKKKIPSPQEYFLSEPMYEETMYEGEEVWDVLNVIYFKGTFDSYCPECGKESTFQAITPERPANAIRNVDLEKLQRQHSIKPTYPCIEPNIYQVVAQCARRNWHLHRYLFLVTNRYVQDSEKKTVLQHSIQKIGQFPSFGDLNIPKVRKYANVLNKRLFGELNRAIGLASHDVGVGAYVYLRRVFEALIEEAHQIATKDPEWDEEVFAKSRMAEKISLLKAHLPTFLVEHPGMYSLLSKGIHELSEEECLDHFNTLRIGIELILDEKLEAAERAKKMEEAKKALAKAIGEHKA